MRLRKVLHLVLVVALPSGANATECLPYGKPGTSVSGTLTRESVETLSAEAPPRKVKQIRWILTSEPPFCVTGDAARGDIHMEGASTMEVWPVNENDLIPYIGKSITVLGQLMPTHLPHYHSYLILQMKSFHENK